MDELKGESTQGREYMMSGFVLIQNSEERTEKTQLLFPFSLIILSIYWLGQIEKGNEKNI